MLIIALGIALIVIAGLAVTILLKTQYPTLLPSPKSIVIENQIPSFTFDFKDKKALLQELENKNVWAQNSSHTYPKQDTTFTASKITIIFTDKPSSDPFFTQNDTSGKLVISSQTDTNPKKGEITITISLGDFLLNQEQKERLPGWVSPRFWQSLGIINNGVDRNSTEEIFTLTKT